MKTGVTCPHCRKKLEITVGIVKIRKQKRFKKNRPYPAVVSIHRIANLCNAFPSIKWNKETLKVTVPGFGDKPGFTIDGVGVSTHGNFKVMWKSISPGGGNASISYWKNGKKKIIVTAFKYSKEVMEEIYLDLFKEENT